MKIGYFVPDLSDPAVDKRVRMLRAGGAEVVLFGFRRSEAPVAEVAGVAAVDLGRTFDARLAQRVGMVLLRTLQARRWRGAARSVDVFMARNLEMLALAARVRDAAGSSAPLVYECLDVHRLMTSGGVPGRLLRQLERALLGRCRLLVVSSPAFLDAHFARQKADVPTLLLGNKLLQLAAGTGRAHEPPPGPPWRIGWFGMIRCGRSLTLLSRVAAENPGLVEIVIRGRPARSEFEDFDAAVTGAAGVSFGGAYTADQLPALYGDVHFTWCVDYFEEGLNSTWLLPNRLYEGSLHGAVSLALPHVETGRWLSRHGTGVLLQDPVRDLATFLHDLTPERYRDLRASVAAIPRGELAAGPEECRDLVRVLAGLGSPA